jgi:hypothetical protein
MTNLVIVSGLLGTFGDSGSFGGFAPFSCPEEGRKNRVVLEGRFLHFPRGGSRALDFTKYDTAGKFPKCIRAGW